MKQETALIHEKLWSNVHTVNNIHANCNIKKLTSKVEDYCYISRALTEKQIYQPIYQLLHKSDCGNFILPSHSSLVLGKTTKAASWSEDHSAVSPGRQNCQKAEDKKATSDANIRLRADRKTECFVPLGKTMKVMCGGLRAHCWTYESVEFHHWQCDDVIQGLEDLKS